MDIAHMQRDNEKSQFIIFTSIIQDNWFDEDNDEEEKKEKNTKQGMKIKPPLKSFVRN